MRAVRAAVRSGLTGWRVQAWAIGLVMLATAASATLGTGLLADSDAPFDHAFAAQRGADVAVTVAARAGNGRTVDSRKELAATARLAGVTAAAGPFAEAAVTVTSGAAAPAHAGRAFIAGRAGG
jgi:putative ABC transport system permease protein